MLIIVNEKGAYTMFFYGYYDLLLVLVPLLIGLWAQHKVNATYEQYSHTLSARGLTGAQAARTILDANGLTGVRVERTQGKLTDHYDPKANVIRLSDGVYGNTSISAIGVAAHECGHAVQQASGYFPMKIRSAIIPVTNFGSALAMPLILVGLILGASSLVSVGLIGFLLIAVFQLVTLPVEFNASNRALAIIAETGMLSEGEQRGAKKVLTAAALTYVAALISALSQFLRMFLIYGNRRERR